MANRLKKLADVRYTPGSPYVPGTPAYCTTVVKQSTGVRFNGGGSSGSTQTIYESDELTITVTDTTGGASYGTTTETSRVCYPAVAAIPAGNPTLQYLALNAWNGGGRSIDPLLADGMFRFDVSAAPSAVVVGLVREDASTSPGEASHAFYVHGAVVEIMERGAVVATSPVAHAATTRMAISREAGIVTYLHGEWTYTSAVETHDPVYLDASIYASGDFVDNPELVNAPGILTGSFAGTLPPLEFRFFEDPTPEYADFTGRLPALFAMLEGSTGLVGSFAGTLPALSGLLADRAYGEFRGVMPALHAALDGGYPQVSIATFVGALPPLSGWNFGLTGEVGSFSGTLPALSGMAVDRAGYGEVRGELPALRGMLLSVPDTPAGEGYAGNTYLVTGGYLVGTRRVLGRAYSGLELGDTLSIGLLLEETVFEALALGSNVSAVRALTAVVRSGLLLGGDASRGSANQQYAVNALTAALSTYTGFNFNSYAMAGGQSFASRQDGVYIMRPGDDDGAPISVTIDFGEFEYGSIKAKNVEDIFLGLTTDGEVIVTLRADGTDYAYKAIQRGAHHLVEASKGVNARRWNMVLESVDATEFVLDSMEHIVNLSTRRWTR